MSGMKSMGNQTIFTDLVVSRLKKMLGDIKGPEVLSEILGKLGKNTIETPDELKRVADELIARGGLSRLIGHSLLTEALLRGARP